MMPFPFDNSYARLLEGFFEFTLPTPVNDPQWIALNRNLASELGLDLELLDSPEGLAYLAGNQVPPGSQPLAMAYAGHQFGGFSPQLGDGRAILLGEVIGNDGLRRDIQLKGAGPTPYSRRGDGRSALGPVLREYIVSEAMAALGVPTTRALAAVWSGDQVRREGYEPGGILTRVARSHIRVGTFQYFAARQDPGSVRQLADYVIDRHYSAAHDCENPYRALLDSVIERQAELIAQWMSLGFIHGVMNTDNMAISGDTIDYGPCAFLDDYDPSKKFSYIDQQGRYAYQNQPHIAHWNLTRFAETLLPLLSDDESKAVEQAEQALQSFPDIFQRALAKRFCAKIGLHDHTAKDYDLVHNLLSLMARDEVDFTLAFRSLRELPRESEDSRFITLFAASAEVKKWLTVWRSRLQQNGGGEEKAKLLMRQVNPVFIPRNHRIEEAIQAGQQSDFKPFHELNQILQHPFDEQEEFAHFEDPPKPEERVQATFCGT
ncbi:MAG: YdiU family protein [Verrucomicrobiales bacterium]|nr:YdiU family protein [Verrucomicrobiales bacterium]